MVSLAACGAIIEKFKTEHPGIVRAVSERINLRESWPRPEVWKPYYAHGVYIIIDPDGFVLYIGKSVAPAKRMHDHFLYNNVNKTLKTIHSWGEYKPVSVVIASVGNKQEARFLERYLIFKLNPTCNLD